MEALDQQSKKKLIRLAVIYAVVILVLLTIANRTPLNKWFSKLYVVLRPVVIGLILSYFCNPIFKFLDQKLLRRLRPYTLRRVLSLILTYVFLFALLAALVAVIVPPLLRNLANLAFNYDIYVAAAVVELNSIFEKINLFVEKITHVPDLIEYWDNYVIEQRIAALIGQNRGIVEYIRTIDTTSLLGVLGSLIGGFKDYIFGLFISIYFLASKELRYAQTSKLRSALFSNQANSQISKFIHTANRSFGGFLTGRLLDSLLVFLILYIAFLVLHLPYAVLLAALIGLFNIIPIIGPFLGAIPAALSVLLISPSKIIPFLIIVVIVQQVDMNIISPNIMGTNTGVSALCVIIAISTMGALWKIPGMILGIPLFATILEIVDMVATDRLQKKGLPSSVRSYYAPDSLLDAARDAELPADLRRMTYERRILKIRQKADRGQALSPLDRFRLWFYRVGCKIRLFGVISDRSLVRVSAENAALEIRRAFRAQSTQKEAPADLPATDEKEGGANDAID